jgi:hypothetical protein
MREADGRGVRIESGFGWSQMSGRPQSYGTKIGVFLIPRFVSALAAPERPANLNQNETVYGVLSYS